MKDIAIQVQLNLGLEGAKSFNLVRALASLYMLKKDAGMTDVVLINDLCEAIEEEDAMASDLRGEMFRATIAEVLKFDRSFGMIFRAKELAGEYGNIFVESRIMTDFRPSFPDNLTETLDAGLIIHQLKLTYHHDDATHSELFIALDAEDLQELKEDILRAERKEKSLRNKLEASGVTLLALDGLHS